MSDWAPGYHWSDLHRAQERFELRFPPDLIELLIEKRPVRGYDWNGSGEPIRGALAWPLEGLLFDVEHDDLWLPQWGERPEKLADRRAAVTELVAGAPKLIPSWAIAISRRSRMSEAIRYCRSIKPISSITAAISQTILRGNSLLDRTQA